MRVLIADDDPISRRLLTASLTGMGHEVVSAENGGQAWEALHGESPPRLAVLDWMMPEIDGIEICRRIRQREGGPYLYLILLTARGSREDVVAGLEAGADDYIAKPFDRQELLARIRAGERIVYLEENLALHILELERALRHVKQLQGLLPICMHCKSIRDAADNWHRLENYIEEHSAATFTHALCQSCLERHYGELASDPPEGG